MFSSSDPKTRSNTTRITSIVESHIDTFINNIFDIYRSSGGIPTTETVSGTAYIEVAICDAVDVAIRRRRNERTSFSRLDTDVVHSIFGTALDMNQIHDPNFPLHDLDVHRQRIHRMRLVSTAWNKFLLSSPRYWQVLDLRSPPSTIAAGVKRSGSAPLCVYSIREITLPPPDQLVLELVWCAARIQTLRSNDPQAYRLCKSLLRTRTSALKTLQLTENNMSWFAESSVEPSRDLPVPSSIRNLTAVGWQPSSTAVWLVGLRQLVLHDLFQIDAEVLLVLSACANLEWLGIECIGRSDDAADVPGVPSILTLPYLQVMDLKFKSDEPALNFLRRLDIPQLFRASLDLDRDRADYRQFMSRKECARYPSFANITVEDGYPDCTRLIYETECRRFAFQACNTKEHAQAFHDLVQEFQTWLKVPSLTVKGIKSTTNIELFLKSIGDQNIETLEAHLDEGDEEAGGFLASIGVLSALPDGPVTNDTDQSFQSVKSIAIYGGTLDLTGFTALVEESTQWLEEIDLVDCRFDGMQCTEAVERLAAVGVTLRCVGCYHFEDPWL